MLKMNKYKIITAALTTALSISAFAEQIPTPSKSDSRIRQQTYNANDVTVISASYGFVTAIIFSDQETILDVTSGFPEGWNLNISEGTSNILYVKPIPILQNSILITPNEKDWRTNIIVRTNKRLYVFEAVYVSPDSQDRHYAVNFRYPDDEKAAREAAKSEQQRQSQLIAIEKALAEPPTPRNWNFTAKVNPGSEAILPDFAYDDGSNTYLGFARSKSIPSAFIREGEEEILVNFSMRQDNHNFVVMVIHVISPFILLRNGKQVVGVFNRGYGQQDYQYENTTVPNVERVLK